MNNASLHAWVVCGIAAVLFPNQDHRRRSCCRLCGRVNRSSHVDTWVRENYINLGGTSHRANKCNNFFTISRAMLIS